jgi:hypothetical protein
MKNIEKPAKKGGKKNKVRRVMKFMKFIIPAAVVLTGLAVSPSLVFAETGTSGDDGSGTAADLNTVTAADEDSAVTISGDWNDKHPVKLKGAGTLRAEGNGAVRIKGRTDKTEGGVVNISGNGVLVINDFEGDLDLTISGYGGKVELKKDVWMYWGFGGDAEIKGSGFAINIMGNNLEIYARGRALVFLAGEGSYEVFRSGSQES